MRRRTPSSPDWSGRWRCGSVRGAPSTQTASSSSSTCCGSIELRPDPLDRRLVEDPPDEARQRERGSRVRAAVAALRPAAVVGPDVDPGQDDLAMAGARAPAARPRARPPGARRPLGAAGRRDDAVGAEERAAVLDLDERPGPLDRRAVVGDPVDRGRHARQRRQRRGRTVARAVAAGRPSIASSASSSARSASFARCRRAARRRRSAANASRPDLDRAARDDDLRIGVGSARAAHGVRATSRRPRR